MTELHSQISAALAGRYVIRAELGRGGTATVFRADDLKHNRQVAIKVLNRDLAADLGDERFLREVRVTAQLQHPNILTLIDSGSTDGLLYYVMPLIEGDSLRARLERERELPVADVVRLLRDVLEGLSHAHERGIVHRDIKPENILITGRHALLADFGIARAIDQASTTHGMTREGTALGTPAYMAPEQAAADQLTDHRADIYAAGVIAYEMLAGQPPFAGLSSQAVMIAHITEVPVNVTTRRATVPAALAAVIMRCLEKKPADRPQSAMEVISVLDSLSLESATPSDIRPTVIRKRRLPVVALAAALLFAVVTLAVMSNRSPLGDGSNTVIAILPAVPTTDDSVLTRLGRDLVVTLSTNLDGVGPIQTVDALTVLAQSPIGARPLSAKEAVALGRKLGAASIVRASLVRVGQDVEVNLGMYETSSERETAKAKTRGSISDLPALTDSASWALLREIWKGDSVPTPTFEAAATKSIPALSAFLEGEEAILQNKWGPASDAFMRAIKADSNFWWAECRYRYARSWALGEVELPPPNRCAQHREDLPIRERLLQSVAIRPDSATPSTVSLRISRLKELTRKYPDYWPGWLAYADMILHQGLRVGLTLADAREGFKRATELNPRLIPAWDHLSWVYLAERDSAGFRSALDTMRVLSGPDAIGQQAGTAMMLGLSRGEAPAAATLDSMARTLLGLPQMSAAQANFSSGWLAHFGFPAAEIGVSSKIIAERDAGAELLSAHYKGAAWSWAARGAWDSAMTVSQSWSRAQPSFPALREPYRVAVIGAVFGAIDTGVVARWRPSYLGSIKGMQPFYHLGSIWLDGLAALARRDSAGIRIARSALNGTGAVPQAVASIDAVLESYETAAQGNFADAGDRLAKSEMRLAEAGYPSGQIGGDFTFGAVNRLLAATWLTKTGDAERAAALLNFFDTYSLNANAPGSASGLLSSLVVLQRARIADVQNNCRDMKKHYVDFIRRYDAARGPHEVLVNEARTNLSALETAERKCVGGKQP